jgi:cell wall-associated NlpC family hydrolase
MHPQFASCTVYAAPLRAAPTHRAEQVSELLYGEAVRILEDDDKGWQRVRCLWDGYEGWCTTGQLHKMGAETARAGAPYLVTGTRSALLFEDGFEAPLPLGAALWNTKPTGGANFKGRKERLTAIAAGEKCPVTEALRYREAPYVWGGRTPSGIDCSGLVQMAFKLCGKVLPRDASQQAEVGETVDFLQHAQRGDIAFFDNEEGRITHVGLLLDGTHILHATDTSGRVVTDRIDGEGIVSVQLRRRTHRLRLIRRFSGRKEPLFEL